MQRSLSERIVGSAVIRSFVGDVLEFSPEYSGNRAGCHGTKQGTKANCIVDYIEWFYKASTLHKRQAKKRHLAFLFVCDLLGCSEEKIAICTFAPPLSAKTIPEPVSQESSAGG